MPLLHELLQVMFPATRCTYLRGILTADEETGDEKVWISHPQCKAEPGQTCKQDLKGPADPITHGSKISPPRDGRLDGPQAGQHCLQHEARILSWSIPSWMDALTHTTQAEFCPSSPEGPGNHSDRRCAARWPVSTSNWERSSQGHTPSCTDDQTAPVKSAARARDNRIGKRCVKGQTVNS